MSVIERHQRRRRGHARRVTIDLDPTDDATHGAQQLTFFNKYSRTRGAVGVLHSGYLLVA